ncbi:MAG: transketolase C-terminal domain-containing protein [Clostridia bacterium]|nr:transketolase C-terminal domain-containing protein [Clostridia bacterium]
MRAVFNKTLLEIAKNDPRIHMVLADIGYGEIEPFRDTFPDRYYNVGVAEQNMTGVACGIAMEGNIAVTYSIANFPTLRCLEQIRNDVCYHNANVKIVIIGGGVSYGPLGMSHHSTEDIAIMRALPNMVVVVPCDNYEAEAATKAMIEYNGPLYYRCGYKGERDIHQGPVDFKIGKAITVREGKDVTLMFAGPVGINVLKAADILEAEGISCRIVSMHTIKPIDKEAIKDASENTGGIITIEEHNLSGGLGSAVAEVICDDALSPKVFKRIALPDVNVSLIGHQEWIREQYGMSDIKIAEQIRIALGR